MTNWQEFEHGCSVYLNSKFGRFATFNAEGGSDSTISDIKACTSDGKSFYIEAKKSPAQCGQFVLLPDVSTKTFKYSASNATPQNAFSSAIIAHMEKSFDEYKDAGTKGKSINIENGNKIFTSWIIQYYQTKGVKFIITNNNILLPVEDIVNYFDVTATYRIKRSGSSSVRQKDIETIQNYLARNYNITASFVENRKLFISSKFDLDNERFILLNNEYMISKRKTMYEIRRLSNTFNANVIFSITLHPEKQGISDGEFISFLKQTC